MIKFPIIEEDKSIRQAMEKINKSGIAVVIIVSKEKKFIGIVTDGDIRRAFSIQRKMD